MKYLSWQEKNIGTASADVVAKMYNDGFLFTRIGKGVMQQTRSVRINLGIFELSSENRRVLKKVAEIVLSEARLPILPSEYKWSIAKLAKDFYETKFGDGVMSAAKVKEMLTDKDKSNFNALLDFSDNSNKSKEAAALGHVICYRNEQMLHYCYPFYDLTSDAAPKDMGLGMMIQAIIFAQKLGLRYIYLGSLQRPADTYKLQFKGLEWYDGKEWRDNMEEAKKILKEYTE